MKLETKFQDENFKLGEVADVDIATMPDGRIKAQAEAKSGGVHTFFYDDLKTFANDWEDAPKEPEYYYIDIDSGGIAINFAKDLGINADRASKQIGNYFETKEEAEKAVEKLKAWKRLEDKGFKFKGYTDDSGDLFSCQVIRCSFDDFGKESREDLNLLFGGEE